MLKFFAPVVGLAVFLGALFTIPMVWAQEAAPVVETPAALTMIPVIGDIIRQVQKWLPVVFQIVGAFAMIAAMTANQTDDKIVNAILKVVNIAGMNFGTAKNDPDVAVSRNGSTSQS